MGGGVNGDFRFQFEDLRCHEWCITRCLSKSPKTVYPTRLDSPMGYVGV